MRNVRIILAFATVIFLVGPLVVTSVHAMTYYTLQLGVSGRGTLSWVAMYQGSVYTSGSTISDMVITVPQGTGLTFTATPSGDSFDSWTLDQSSRLSTNPYVITSIGDVSPVYHTVIANFGQSFAPNPPLQNSLEYSTFNVGVDGSGKVYWSSSYDGSTYDSGWIESSSAFAIPKNGTVTFTAVPLNGHHFSNWVIDGVDQGSNNPFIMYGTGSSAVATVEADFDQIFFANPPLQTWINYGIINVGVEGSGKLYWNASYGGVAYTSGSTDIATPIRLPQGAMVSFTAVPMTGDHLANWIVDSATVASTNPYIVSSVGVGSPSTVFAVFDQDFVPNPPLPTPSTQYDSIQVNILGSGRLYWSSSYGTIYDSGSTDSSASIVVPHGATVTFTAVPLNGYRFSNWMINSANDGSINPYVVHSAYLSPPGTVAAVFT
jgi:hypothetical protein